MKSPFFANTLPKGKTWLKLDLQKTLATQGIDFSALTSQEPTQMLGRLQAVKGMTEVGDETIDGTDTTHYRGHIDVTKIPQAAKIQALTNARYGPYDVWVGKDDGYVHRLKLAYSYGPSGSARQTVTLTMDLSDFGQDVSITPPSAADTFDATKASLKGLGS